MRFPFSAQFSVAVFDAISETFRSSASVWKAITHLMWPEVQRLDARAFGGCLRLIRESPDEPGPQVDGSRFLNWSEAYSY
jgi:hypothetical protein